MKGIIKFKVSDNKLLYQFELKRNITILQGISANGKTTLLRMLVEATEEGTSLIYKVETNARYYVFSGTSQGSGWKESLYDKTDTVIFIEENNRFVYSKEFAEFVKTSGNYFVIVGRKPLNTLPYSIQEIYTLISYKPENSLKRVYEFKELYSNFEFINTDFDLIITEDAKSGYEFYQHLFSNISVISANGNSNILNTIDSVDKHNILCIVDGAAFGSYLQDYYEDFENDIYIDKRITFWMPESFEYVILEAGVVTFRELPDILLNPSDYIECKEFPSWERYFTYLLIEKSDQRYKYKKSSLDPYYLQEKNMKKVIEVMPEEIKNYFQQKNHE